jgi:hypothetical protein
MVRFMRTARAARGKGPQLIQFAKEITEFMKSKYGTQSSVYMDSFGDYLTIRWFTEYESLAAGEQITEKFMADQEYWQKVAKAADLFIEGSVTDTVMRSL